MALSESRVHRGMSRGACRKARHDISKAVNLGFLMSAWFYILRLKSGALYIGATTDLNQRYRDHCSGKACRTTKLDPPVALVHSEEYQTFGEARKREAQIKRWSRAKKEALVSGDTARLHELSKGMTRVYRKSRLELVPRPVEGLVERFIEGPALSLPRVYRGACPEFIEGLAEGSMRRAGRGVRPGEPKGIRLDFQSSFFVDRGKRKSYPLSNIRPLPGEKGES